MAIDALVLMPLEGAVDLPMWNAPIAMERLAKMRASCEAG
ncbi:conserved protein of unknown function [Ralstonia solanacearum CFBP2957]|nr:conserved protein of unknown function [Ralstonia solanacearum CFBP2957]